MWRYVQRYCYQGRSFSFYFIFIFLFFSFLFFLGGGGGKDNSPKRSRACNRKFTVEESTMAGPIQISQKCNPNTDTAVKC